jgi:hypothetical protein
MNKLNVITAATLHTLSPNYQQFANVMEIWADGSSPPPKLC